MPVELKHDIPVEPPSQKEVLKRGLKLFQKKKPSRTGLGKMTAKKKKKKTKSNLVKSKSRKPLSKSSRSMRSFYKKKRSKFSKN